MCVCVCVCKGHSNSLNEKTHKWRTVRLSTWLNDGDYDDDNDDGNDDEDDGAMFHTKDGWTRSVERSLSNRFWCLVQIRVIPFEIWNSSNRLKTSHHLNLKKKQTIWKLVPKIGKDLAINNKKKKKKKEKRLKEKNCGKMDVNEKKSDALEISSTQIRVERTKNKQKKTR